VKLVLTLLARDEADVVDAHLAFHLNAGVDFVVATDNGSEDGTTEILERYERAGRLHLIREPGDDMRQSEWVTRMARFAVTELGADWVINSDADEFWWPRSGSLKDVLEAVPDRFGVVRGAWRHFLPRPDDGDPFFERMIARLRVPAFPGDKATIYHAHQKVAHRGRADVVVAEGNHDADAAGRLAALRGWYPLEVLHFSFRSRTQFEQKVAWAFVAWERNPNVGASLHQKLAYDAYRAGTLDEYYRAFLVDDEALERGLREGKLGVDTRLRDALRAVRTPDGSFRLPASGEAGLPAFPAPAVDDDAAFLEEISPLVEIDGLVRVERRVDALDRRLGKLERARLGRLGGSLAARAGRAFERRRLARP
jgi:glycosyl transferase family 2